MRGNSRHAGRLGRMFDDPFLNGLVTLAVVMFTVYVSYTANNGLPFVPKYKVSVDVPDAGQLVRHAEVRIGGARVGQVLQIHAVPRTRDEPAHARLDLALNQDLEPLAGDTRSEIRVASILGGKYVSLVPGKSPQKLGKGDILPLSRAATAVDIDEAFRVFDPKTRSALQATVIELGNAVAGRGVGFNRALGNLADSAAPAQRVLGQLADPNTDLAGFVDAAARAVTTLAPVSGPLVGMLSDGATTLAAVNAAGDELGRALDALPGAAAQSTTTLRNLQPALASAAAISSDLQPAAKIIPTTARRLDETLRAATPVARRGRGLAAPLLTTFKAVDAFSRNRNAINAIKLLGSNDLATFGASGFIGLGGLLRALAPAQMNCNILGVWARNLSSSLSQGDANGGWLRMLPVLDLTQITHSATPAANLHVNAYPNADANECEGANEPYLPGQRIGNPAGNQSRTVPQTAPPAAATRRARAAGLLRSTPR
jgi:virulence factor Mce-like protein